MSTSAVKPQYAKLLAKTLPAVIHSEQENEHYLAILGEFDRRPGLNAAEKRLAELLTLLIEDFETRAYPLKSAGPAETVSELMAANGLKQKDLIGIFGTASIVSEVLNGKRKLTTEHIRKLSLYFQVSPEIFF